MHNEEGWEEQALENELMRVERKLAKINTEINSIKDDVPLVIKQY